MAEAKKCDRCGMFYISLHYEEDRPSCNRLKVYGIATLSFNNHNIKLYDLCPDCAKAFYEFVGRGDTDDSKS